MKSLFLIIFYIQNGIIAASPHAMTRHYWWMTILLDLQEEIQELEEQGQKFETLAQTLMNENKNLKGQIETRVKEYADLEEKMAVQTDQIRIMQTDQTKKFEMMQQQLLSMEKQLTDKIENLQKQQLETQEQTEINTNITNVPLKISINVWECYYMCEEELSKGSLTKSVPEPCSRNNLCGSYHHIENYNGRPVYKRNQNAPYNTEIYLYYQTNGTWCLTSVIIIEKNLIRGICADSS